MTKKPTKYPSLLLFLLITGVGLSIHIQGVNAQKVSTPTPKPSASPKITVPPSVTATPSANDSTETSKETIEEIKRRIEKNSDLVKGVTDQAGNKVGLVGEVTRITGESLTVKTQSAVLIMSIPANITLKSGSKTIKATDIAVGNWATIIGTEIDDAFTPTSIAISTVSLRPKPQEVALGTISAVNKSEIEFTPRGSTEAKTLTIAKTSSFQDSDGSTAKATDFETDVTVLVVAQEDDDELVLATLRSLVPLEQ